MNSIDNLKVKQVMPVEKELDFEGLYLNHNLQGLTKKLGRAMVITNYVTDINDVIATKTESGSWQIAKEVKNDLDWSLFQEIAVQSDILITAKEYLKRFEKLGSAAQNIFGQFEKGGSFESLGDWRLKNGFKKRSPDIAIVSRSLDFTIPDQLNRKDRKIIVFTTFEQANSNIANSMINGNVDVIGAGIEGVDGKRLYETLNDKGYKVIYMTTGPNILKILLDADIIDRLYITQVQREIKKSKSDVQKVLLDGGNVENLKNFRLTEKCIQENVTAADGTTKLKQNFLIFDNIKLISY